MTGARWERDSVVIDAEAPEILQALGRRRGSTMLAETARHEARRLSAKLGRPIVRRDIGYDPGEGARRAPLDLTPPPDPGPAPSVDTTAVEAARAHVAELEAAATKEAQDLAIAERDKAAILASIADDDAFCGLRGTEADENLRRVRAMRLQTRMPKREGEAATAQAELEEARAELRDLDTVVHRWKLRVVGAEVRHRLTQLAQDPELLRLLAGDHRWWGKTRNIYDLPTEKYLCVTAGRIEEFGRLVGVEGEARTILRRVPALRDLFDSLLTPEVSTCPS